jgi:hypothetical protein
MLFEALVAGDRVQPRPEFVRVAQLVEFAYDGHE